MRTCSASFRLVCRHRWIPTGVGVKIPDRWICGRTTPTPDLHYPPGIGRPRLGGFSPPCPSRRQALLSGVSGLLFVRTCKGEEGREGNGSGCKCSLCANPPRRTVKLQCIGRGRTVEPMSCSATAEVGILVSAGYSQAHCTAERRHGHHGFPGGTTNLPITASLLI